MGFKRDLVTLCVSAGVGTHNETIFTSGKSSPPLLADGRATLVIIETGGTSPERTNTTRVGGQVQKVTMPAYERPSAIFITRATTPAAAEAMCRAAYNAVVGVRNTFVNSGWYREINPLSEPADATGPDDRGQARYTFNVIAIKRPS